MTNRSEMPDRRRDQAFTAAFALMTTAIACAIVLFAVPRPVPLELPVLALDATKARAQIRQDEELAQRATSPLAKQLYDLLLDVGRSEIERDAVLAQKWQHALGPLLTRARRELGPAGMRAVRAYATQRFMLALSAQLPEPEGAAVCGAQRELLFEHGYLAPSGRFLAPELTVRATYKVRWNMIFGAPPSSDLSPTERLAYEGFRALEAQNLPGQVRSMALLDFIEAGGGEKAEQAWAIWQAQAGNRAPLIARAQAGTAIRLRNMALALSPRAEPE